MTKAGTSLPQWTMVDEGWGRKAVDFSALSEPGNCREYVAVHHRLGVDAGDRLLDVACGSGLAIELARLRGASCSGIDASPRLVAVARDRNPESDIRVGDMHALPWDPASFDVVTSFRGIWGTTSAAVGEIFRVLRPGGRSFTTWFILNETTGPGAARNKGSMRFDVDRCDYALDSARVPEAALAYKETALREMYARSGQSIREPIHLGSWSGQPDATTVQDIVVATAT